MQEAGGFRRLLQTFLFPDLTGLLMASEQLARRMDLLDKSLGMLDRSVNQAGNNLVQLDNDILRIDKATTALGKSIGLLNKGMEQLNKDVDEQEKNLGIRLGTLKAKLETDHAKAMTEIVSLLHVHALPPESEYLQSHLKAPPDPASPGTPDPESPPEAILAASSSWPRQPASAPPAEPSRTRSDASDLRPENSRALSELTTLLGLPARPEILNTRADALVEVAGGQPPLHDLTAILEHIRRLELGAQL